MAFYQQNLSTFIPDRDLCSQNPTISVGAGIPAITGSSDVTRIRMTNFTARKCAVAFFGLDGTQKGASSGADFHRGHKNWATRSSGKALKQAVTISQLARILLVNQKLLCMLEAPEAHVCEVVIATFVGIITLANFCLRRAVDIYLRGCMERTE